MLSGAGTPFGEHGDGAPAKSQDFVGRGGARERTQFSPQAKTETSGLCSDVVQGALFKGRPCWGSNPQIAGARPPFPLGEPADIFPAWRAESVIVGLDTLEKYLTRTAQVARNGGSDGKNEFHGGEGRHP